MKRSLCSLLRSPKLTIGSCLTTIIREVSISLARWTVPNEPSPIMFSGSYLLQNYNFILLNDYLLRNVDLCLSINVWVDYINIDSLVI